MSKLFLTLEIGFSLFLFLNWRLLVFLQMRDLPDFAVVAVSKCRFNHKTRMSGILYGTVERKGLRVLRFGDLSLGGDIYLQVGPFTDIIPRRIPYGSQVIIYGKMTTHRTFDIVMPVTIICENKMNKILKTLNRRLSLCMTISIVINLILWLIENGGISRALNL